MAPTEVRRETLRVGSPMKLQCSLEATADHVTEWYKDDRKLISGGKFVIKESGAAELYIPNTGISKISHYVNAFGQVLVQIIKGCPQTMQTSWRVCEGEYTCNDSK